MNRAPSIAALATAVILSTLSAGISLAHGEDGPPPIDPAKGAEFDTRMFGAPLGTRTAYACFVRRYDADHLARHPRQKVSAMKLLVTAEYPLEDQAHGYSFRLGVKYRHRNGDFDSSGFCGHVVAEDGGNELRLGCGVDCDGGGIGVALSKDDKAAIIRLERVRIWQNNKPDDEAGESLVAGADDKIFRLDRTDAGECASLVTDRKELAALRHK
jgi:hypothetical protein